MSSTLEHTAPELHGFGEAVLKMFMHSAPIGFAFLDRNLRFVAVNDKLAEINGLPAEAHIGRHVLEILPTLAATVEEVADRIVQTGKPVPNHEFTGETRATIGEQRWWSESWYPIHDPQGTLIGFGAMVEDITERKRAEAAVEAARERRRKALSIETVGRLIFNLEGRILESNAAVEHMSGYSIDELRSMNHWDVLTPPEYAGVTARAIEELATLGKTAPYEMELVRKDGTRWWGLFASTRVAGQGRQLECVEFIIDITKNKRIEHELREADRRKNEFLATLAHELRNPMAPLKNGLHIVRLSSEPDSPVHRVVDVMDRQLNHLVRLVDDLLDVGRITSGKVALRRRRVELREVLARSIEASQAIIDAHHHELDVDEGAEQLFVHGDLDRLAQIFSNLLGNAAKYTDDGGRIRVAVRRDASEAVVQVSDTGVGIPAAELTHVFDLFSQVRAHQGRTEGGLGIGLSLVKQLIAMHGGEVTAESAGLGKGTTFTVRLPLMQGSKDEIKKTSSIHTSPCAKRLRILVVDDNADVAGSLAMLLEMQGHEVLSARDGVEAIARAGDNNIDVALLDLGMPRMDGIETARRLREMPGTRNMLLAAVTGRGQDIDRERTREAGFDHHLVKPVDPARLTEILQTVR
jgi:PAS domain S-box-containing protein